MIITPRRVYLVASMALLAPACDRSVEVENDGGGTTTDGGADSEADGPESDAAGDDVGGEPEAGPLTLVVNDVEIVQERLCDLDGDGTLDNAVTDLGPTGAALFSTAVQALLQGELITEGRMLIHFPWLEDATTPHDPEAVVLVIEGLDADEPPDPTDDFSGDDAFHANPSSLDACGEPRYGLAVASIDAGIVTASSGTVALPLAAGALEFREAQLQGRIDPRGAAADLSLCAGLLIRELGALYHPQFGEMSMLDLFLAGGSAFGVPGLPGLSPDVDLDGDGLERLELDEDDRVARCIDGDRTPIDGSECWQDPRMADAFSMSMRLEAVSAALAGPTAAWEWDVEGECSEPPTDPTAWGPCPAGICGRWERRACVAGCGAVGTERCAWDCSTWEPCIPDANDSVTFTACGDVVLEDDTRCGGSTPTLTLTDGTDQLRGFRLSEVLTLGQGPLTVEARTRAELSTTELPGRGWAIVVALGDEGDWIGPQAQWLGVSHGQRGYSLEWHYYSHNDPEDQVDGLILGSQDGSGSYSELSNMSTRYGVEIVPALDSSTEGPAEQRLRLVIQPDDPNTSTNELLVFGYLESGPEVVVPRMRCRGDECPVPIQVGDRVRVGMTAATDELDAVSTIESGNFTVERSGICP